MSALTAADFDRYARRHWGSMVRYARRVRRPSYLDPEDIVQDALLKAWRNRHLFEGRASFSTWVANLFWTQQSEARRQAGKRRNALTRLGLENLMRRLRAAPQDERAIDQAREEAERAISRLSAPLQDVLRLRLEGLEYQEIADALGWPIGTVRSRLHKAREFVRYELDASPRRWRLSPLCYVAVGGEDE